MKNVRLLVAISFVVLAHTICNAQQGYITTVVGSFWGYGGDGGPATGAELRMPAGICRDKSGNTYISDRNNSCVRKVDNSGIITTFAGIGLSRGFSGDGGPATAAQINGGLGIAVDDVGNVYIADDGNNSVRKITPAGIITTFAGHTTAGFSGDGGPAIAAQLNSPTWVTTDHFGNVFICDMGNHRIRKVNSAGIITTIAGSGMVGYSGDGGASTSAKLFYPRNMCVDDEGNLYIGDFRNSRIRKVDATGIITTICGTGIAGYTGDGGPATAARINDSWGGVSVDGKGNIYITEQDNNCIRKIDTSGIITTIAGNTVIGYSGDGGPATAAELNLPTYATPFGTDLYVCDQYNSVIRKIEGIVPVSIFADSFKIKTNRLCNGPEITVRPVHYSPGMTIGTDFGDATTDVTPILLSFISGACGTVKHTYKTAGTYIITQVLYIGSTPVDTMVTPYTYTFCRSLPVKIYYEGNGNSIKDAGEPFMSLPTVSIVDSNGIAVDTIPATAGFQYSAYAPVGSVYSFRLLAKPGDLALVCPAGGIIQDTVVDAVTTYPDKYFGLGCPSPSSFNLGVKSVVPVTGVNDQWGYIFLNNTACMASGGTVTLYFSPKWVFDVSRARPAASLVTGNSATWTISSIKPDEPKPLALFYELLYNPATGKLLPRDTVHSHYVITPFSGDADISNNTDDRLDTVRAGVDPNDISVIPAGNILPCTELQYTINFENTGNDTAHNIYVMDTLPVGVDVSSMRIVMASARMDLSILKDGPYTIARFDFPNINLLDSSFRDACHGAVIYTIKANASLPDGTQLPNHAGIFFDVNDVVMTNTVVNTIGILPIDGKGSTCIGTTDTLTNATPGGVWTASNANATVVNGVVTGVTAGLDTISYTVSNACTSQTKTKVVTIGSAVAAPISGPSGVCLGSSATLTDATGGGIWTSSNPAVAYIISSGLVSGLLPGTSTVSYTITNACGTDVATAIFTVHPLPAAFAVLGGGSFCSGGAGVHIGLGSSQTGVNYQAYLGATKVGAAAPGIGSILDLGIFTTPGFYTVVAENATTTCTESMTGSATVAVYPTVIPSITINPITDTTCFGKWISYVATDVNGGVAPLFQWSVNGVAKAGATSTTYTYVPATGDVVAILMESSATCAVPDTTSSSFTPTVIAALLPTVLVSAYPGTHISKGESITLAAAATDAGTSPSYQWILNGTPVAGATIATYTYDQFADNDSVSCLVTSSGDCGGHTSHNAAIIHVSTVGVRTIASNGEVFIYPNPTTDELTITTEKQYTSFTITNSIGQIMMEQPLTSAQTKVNVKSLSAGLYYISLRGSEGVTMQKFVKL